MNSYVLLANNGWIEVTPSIRVSGPHHRVSLAGVVSNQPDNDAEDIRIEDGKIMVCRKNDQLTDRVFTVTYRVNAHGQDSFVNTKVFIRNPKTASEQTAA